MAGQFLREHVAVKQVESKTFRPRRSSYCNWRRPLWSKRLSFNLLFYCYMFAQELPSHILYNTKWPTRRLATSDHRLRICGKSGNSITCFWRTTKGGVWSSHITLECTLTRLSTSGHSCSVLKSVGSQDWVLVMELAWFTLTHITDNAWNMCDYHKSTLPSLQRPLHHQVVAGQVRPSIDIPLSTIVASLWSFFCVHTSKMAPHHDLTSVPYSWHRSEKACTLSHLWTAAGRVVGSSPLKRHSPSCTGKLGHSFW